MQLDQRKKHMPQTKKGKSKCNVFIEKIAYLHKKIQQVISSNFFVDKVAYFIQTSMIWMLCRTNVILSHSQQKIIRSFSSGLNQSLMESVTKLRKKGK